MPFSTQIISLYMKIPMAFHPLISTVVTLYTLIFLYFPAAISALSPVLISTSVLLLSLLRLGAAQRKKKQPEPENPSTQLSKDFAYHDDGDSSSSEMELVGDPALKPNPDSANPSLRVSNDFAYHDDGDSIDCEMESTVDPDTKPDSNTVSPSSQFSNNFAYHDDGDGTSREMAPTHRCTNPSLHVLNDFSYRGNCSGCEMDTAIDPDTDCVVGPSCEKDSVFEPDSKTGPDNHCFIEPNRENCSRIDPKLDSRPCYGNYFVEWNVGAPLEVIYHDECSKMDSVSEPDSKSDPHADCFIESNSEKEPMFDPNSTSCYRDCFVEWDVRAPLEVIYEAYEGEEDDGGEVENTNEKREDELGVIERYASLSMYYPETDTDSSSSDGDSPVIGNWESPENLCFRWDEEDREGLIEIELDCKRNNEVEEDNLIEIDLSPGKFPAR